MTLLGREGVEVEALVTDRYLESLFSAHDRHADDAPADLRLDPAIHDAARRLAADLVRVHPSFRFEERLATRLAETAARMRSAVAAAGEGAVPIEVAFPSLAGAAGSERAPGPMAALPRPLVIGGALTSAAISLAGAAYVAWRLGRPPLSPMARAVRAAQQARLARLAGSVAGRPRLD